MKTALLVMDVQNRMMGQMKNPQPLLNKIKKAIDAAREYHICVIYVRLAFRGGYPEVHSNNKKFSQIKENNHFQLLEESTAIHPFIEPEDTDIVLIKKRFSAFAGNELDALLRSMGVEHLVLTGYSTSGVVLSTLREAADKDYKITVLSDGCSDPDKEVHKVLLEKVFISSAEVVKTKGWIDGLK